MSNRVLIAESGTKAGGDGREWGYGDEMLPQNQQHFAVKHANEITLRRGKDNPDDVEFDESQRLLSGGVRKSFDAADRFQDATLDSRVGSAANDVTGSQHLQSHSQLDVRKFPEDMQHQHEQEDQHQHQRHRSGNEQNGTSVILTPTSLNASTVPTTNSGGVQSSPQPYGNGGGNGRSIPSSDEDYKGPKVWRHLVKHWTAISQPLALLAVFFALWMIAHILFPNYAAPHTGIMRIAFLFVGAQLSGILVTFLHLPDMLGMLFFGVLYTNLGLADFTGYQPLEAFLREMALINIMLLAGLGLDEQAFKRLWLMILRLTLIPTIAEVAVIAVLAYWLLSMPWLWGILLGLVITAVSPNVVVTVMLRLKELRLGLNNGIHTLIYAMTTCNDVVAIFLFGIFLGVIFSSSNLTSQILQGPIGIGVGVVFGYVYGLMLQILPSKNSSYVHGVRFVLTVLGGIIAVIGSKAIDVPSAGALGCVTVAFVAGMGWKRQQKECAGQHGDKSFTVPQRLDLLWKFLKPVSFSLIGKEINFSVLDGRVVAYGVVLVLVGSLFRLGFAYISTYGGNLSWRERAYITISGFPKATVQAALGPIALDLARSMNSDAQSLALASNVLVISVLAIIFTAPLGAILMLRFAPVWLQHSSEDAPPREKEYQQQQNQYMHNALHGQYIDSNEMSNAEKFNAQTRSSRSKFGAPGQDVDTVAVAIPLTISTSPNADASAPPPLSGRDDADGDGVIHRLV